MDETSLKVMGRNEGNGRGEFKFEVSIVESHELKMPMHK